MESESEREESDTEHRTMIGDRMIRYRIYVETGGQV